VETPRGLGPVAAAAAFLVAHLWALPGHVPARQVADLAARIDRFPTGASDDLVAAPIFLLLGKAGVALARRAHEAGAAADAYGLATWGAVFGGIAIWPLLYLFGRLSERRDIAWTAALITLTAPVTWLGAWLPTSHVPGFMLALIAQALLVGALLEAARHDGAAPGVLIVHRLDDPVFARLVLSGALVSAVALGMRPDTVWLTAPLLVAVLALCWRRRARALVGAVVLLCGVAWAAWAVPVMVVVGDPAQYGAALVREMLPGPGHGGQISQAARPAALWDSLLLAWHYRWLGLLVLALAIAGLLTGPRPTPRGRRALLLAVVPYAVLHVFVHDPHDVVFALPLVPVVAYFASVGLGALGRRVLQAGAIAIAVVSLVAAWRL
jgi:hypothetical protein